MLTRGRRDVIIKAAAAPECRTVGQWEQSHEGVCSGADHAGRNVFSIVAQQGSSNPHAVGPLDLRAVGVVHESGGTVEHRVGKVPRTLSRGGYRSNLQGTALSEPEALIIGEEERLVVSVVELGEPYRTTERETEIILPEGRLDAAQSGLAPGIGVERVILRVCGKL